ncbi:PepSY domain-containing protein [Asanoa sp. NPDC050611]|uniref:PepSY domain-containing protein n=1 Tax=Asanoa sp. NPDC050611 TaxID=3157098 RepID=UPI0033D29E5A
MKRTAVIITVAGMAALAVTGTALAAAQDDGPSPLTGIGSAVDPTAEPTDDRTTTAEPSPDDSPTSTRAPLSDGIGAEKARQIALDRVGGGTVTEIESELEHGFATWKVEIVRGGVEFDVYVDRATGTIVKADADDRLSGGRDDSPTHDADDDKGGERGGHGSDDGPGDDRGGDRSGHGGRH